MSDPEKTEWAHEFHKSGNLSDGSDMDYRSPGMGDNSGEDPDGIEKLLALEAELAGMDEKSIMMRARRALLVNLLKLVELGQATPADQSVLAKLLKDNGMVMENPFVAPGKRADGEESQEVADEPLDLPTFETPQYDR